MTSCKKNGSRKAPVKLAAFRLTITVAALTLIVGCSTTPVASSHKASQSSPPAQFPSRSVATRLRPCGADPQKELSAIVGKPVYLDHLGNIGQQPIISDGAVLPKIWLATCNVNIPAYPATALYMQIELTPDLADARLEFAAVRTRMGLPETVVRAPGYGEAAVFDLNKHGDVTVLARQGPEVFTVEVTVTSKPAPSPMNRLRIAKAVAHEVIRENT